MTDCTPWVELKDDFPEKGEQVLAVVDRHGWKTEIVTARWFGGHAWILNYAEPLFYADTILYWCKIPELPKKEQAKKEGIDVLRAIREQDLYCDRNNKPHFAPHDGICFSCHQQIYEMIPWTEAASKLVTGCPVCGRSFCD